MGEAKRILISGRVQGVFFRKFVLDKAIELGLNGHVRNRVDGTVEVVVFGDKEKIKELVGECSVGPIGARVDDVVVSEFNGKVRDGFVRL